jgi:predicted ATPase/DNA-binding SARP family transcriptional activator
MSNARYNECHRVTKLHCALRPMTGRIMQILSLNFLGAFEVIAANRAISAFRTDKVRALLVYLALEASRPQQRDRLAAIFWPESDQESARYNLRLTLHRLRQTLAAAVPGIADTVFTVTRSTITFHPAATRVDVVRFQQLITDCEAHTHADLYRCALCVARLHQAAELYRGELLAGFGIADAPAFEEWLLLRREMLHQLALLALHHLAVAYELQGQLEPALAYARRKLALDPYREETHQQVMRLLARGGQISQALAQYERCRRLLREEVGVDPDAETVALAEQIRTGKFDKGTSWQDDADAERRTVTESTSHSIPLSPTQLVTVSPHHNLPTHLTPFIGREQELAELGALLQEPEVRLVTLVGPGGMGKTRLAVEVGKRALAAFADGVFFVPLASLAAPSAIAAAIATALGLTLQGDLAQALGQILRFKQMLIILDNCEHLLPAAFAATQTTPDHEGATSLGQLVADLLHVAPGVRMLATSRERLNLRAEHLYRVEGMDLAQGATLAHAAGAAAVRLFVKSVQRIQPHFALQQANLSAVLRICRFVQGMPLGLELAAAWADQLTIADIAQEIEGNVDFLTSEQHDVPVRQRSMRAVFAWSWRLLNGQEQGVLRQLSIFRGGFTREAAQTITGASLPVLTSLVHKSLLRVVQQPVRDEQTGNAVRYELHELLRQFAEKQLALIPTAAETVAAQHSQFYLHLLAGCEQRLARDDFKTAVAELQCEIDNLRQAWATAARLRQLEALDAAAFALWLFYEFAGLGAEGAQVFHVAAQCIRQGGETNESAPVPHPFALPLLSKLLAIKATFLVALSQQDQGLVCAQEAIACQSEGEAIQRSIEGETLGHLAWGQALRRQGQNLEARRRLEHALDLVQRHPPVGRLRDWLPEIACRAYGWLCSIALNPSYDYAAANAYAEQKLQLARSLGKRHAELAGLSDLEDIATAMGDYPSAQRYCEQMLEQARTLGNRPIEALGLEHLGRILQLQGRYESGYRLLEAALGVYRALGHTIGELNTLNALLHLSTRLGAYAQAQVWCEQFLHLTQHVESPRGEFLDNLLARTLFAYYSGDFRQALMYAEQSRQVAQRVGDPLRMAQALVLLGHVQSDRQPQVATMAYTQALAYDEALPDQRPASEAQAGLAQLALAQGNLAEAQSQVEAILPLLAEAVPAGMNNPFYLYWVCFQVLAAAGNAQALTLLQQANQRLQHDAGQIEDETLRRSFLEQVPVHRAIVQAYANQPWSALVRPKPTPVDLMLTVEQVDKVSSQPG